MARIEAPQLVSGEYYLDDTGGRWKLGITSRGGTINLVTGRQLVAELLELIKRGEQLNTEERARELAAGPADVGDAEEEWLNRSANVQRF